MRLLTMIERINRTPTGRLVRFLRRLHPMPRGRMQPRHAIRNAICEYIAYLLDRRAYYGVTDG